MELKISPNTVLSETVRVLRKAIVEGRFKPGDRLVEAELCQMLNVSRPSVREALRRLEAERLVDIIPNKGPVIPLMPWEHAEQIYKTRMLLEGEIAALAARMAKPADISDLRLALEAFEDAARRGDAARQISSTKAFYDIVLRIAHNPIIAEILEGLHARISFLRGKSMSRAGRALASAEELSWIANAIADGDEEAARGMAVMHVTRAAEAAFEVYANSAPQEGD
ncbi:GntR family transcriptional regulator [Aureimonas fodinaquatilis]|uniref:GntR family transcriptional regulator n=1 Tax=Aureimonas fodinaquatilis TaxID=2565783 RepID=A0A5B0DTQ1_9HYPH|nr:GntR family transcriptional regulator [Aureimonas fodinaquatilis]